MANILDTVAAIRRYDRINVGGELHPTMPAEIDAFHAVLLDRAYLSSALRFIIDATAPHFLDGPVAEVVEAACGTRVRVLLPKPFDSEHPKACSRCMEAIGLKG